MEHAPQHPYINHNQTPVTASDFFADTENYDRVLDAMLEEGQEISLTPEEEAIVEFAQPHEHVATISQLGHLIDKQRNSMLEAA